MNPTDDHGVHTHDFRQTLGRCICGELATFDSKRPERGGMLDREEYAGLYAAAAKLAEPQLGFVHFAGAPDMETRAELFNEGFDAAHRQGVGGEVSYAWLLSKIAPILDELAGTIRREKIDDLITRIADQVLDNSLIEDADSDERPDQKRGMYGKYFVERLHDPEGKHADCRFFVLDPVHDPYALSALKEYVLTSQDEFPLLAEDLREWISDVDGNED